MTTTPDPRTPNVPGQPIPHMSAGMYWPPQPQTHGPQDDPGPPPAPKRNRLWLYLAFAVGTLLIMAATVGVTLTAQRHSNNAPAVAVLTEPVAQRACRTAIENEWKQRTEIAHAAQTDTEIVVSLQGVDLQETWKTPTGYSVNAMVRYTLTTGIIDPVDDSLSLTCAATGTDDNVTTTVSNRG